MDDSDDSGSNRSIENIIAGVSSPNHWYGTSLTPHVIDPPPGFVYRLPDDLEAVNQNCRFFSELKLLYIFKPHDSRAIKGK